MWPAGCRVTVIPWRTVVGSPYGTVCSMGSALHARRVVEGQRRVVARPAVLTCKTGALLLEVRAVAQHDPAQRRRIRAGQYGSQFRASRQVSDRPRSRALSSAAGGAGDRAEVPHEWMPSTDHEQRGVRPATPRRARVRITASEPSVSSTSPVVIARPFVPACRPAHPRRPRACARSARPSAA